MNRDTSSERDRNQGAFLKRRNQKREDRERISLSGMQSLTRNLALMATGSAALVTLFLLTGVWRSGTGFLNDVYALFDKPQPEPKVDLRSMVVQQVRNVSELTTAVYAMETVVPTSRDRTVGGYVIGTTTLLYIAYGEVRAGVDLSALQETDVKINGDSITLRLPPPQILDSKIDVNRSKVYDYDRGFMSLGPDVAPELQELAQRKTLEKIVESACAGGILQRANDRAKLAISQLLTATGYRKLSVEEQPLASLVCAVNPASTAQPPSALPSALPSPDVPSNLPSDLPSVELPSIQPAERTLPQPPT